MPVFKDGNSFPEHSKQYFWRDRYIMSSTTRSNHSFHFYSAPDTHSNIWYWATNPNLKAFDMVDCGRLMKKLQAFVTGLLSYCPATLMVEGKSVILNSIMSTPQHLSTSAPPSSVLRPLLFALYVNDLCICIDVCWPHTQFIVTADTLVGLMS